MIRPPLPEDIPDLARIHVQAWQESYAGILPPQEIARFDLAHRSRQWTRALANDTTRIAYAPGQGFAQMGPQRDADLAADYPEELYAIYLLDSAKGRGLGTAMLAAVAGSQAFTALVLAGNHTAARFYDKTGAEHIGTQDFDEGGFKGTEDIFARSPPFSF